jgi:hypothetical protein
MILSIMGLTPSGFSLGLMVAVVCSSVHRFKRIPWPMAMVHLNDIEAYAHDVLCHYSYYICEILVRLQKKYVRARSQ